MATRNELLNGADYEGDEAFCDTVVNAIKNHFRASDPCTNMTHKQPGEILSDADDDKLYHVTGESGYPCEEILQASKSCDIIPDFLGVDFYDACNGDYARIKAVDEPGLGHRLTIGLDETAQTLVICNLSDVDVDLGLGGQGTPVLYVFNDAANVYATLSSVALTVGNAQLLFYATTNSLLRSNVQLNMQLFADLDAGAAFVFDSAANVELTDDNGEQAWIYVEPKINQSSTAAYVAILVDVTETALGDASAGKGYNALLDLRVGTTSQFYVTNAGHTYIGGKLNLSGAPESVTISGGVITITESYVEIDTESGDPSDDLNTINGGAEGDILIIKSVNSARDIVVKHLGGNIHTQGADRTLLDVYYRIVLQYDGANWVMVARNF